MRKFYFWKGDRYIFPTNPSARVLNIVNANINETKRTYCIITLQLYQQGLTIPEIAERRSLKQSTIYGHIAALIEMNQPIDVDSLVSEHKKAIIIKCIQTIGDGALTPLKNHLGDDYSYGEIKLVRAWYRRENK